MEGHEDKVYRLKEALHGLKQVPCAWNSNQQLSTLIGFAKSPRESSSYSKTQRQDLLIVCLDVDDITYKITNQRTIEAFKKVMMAEFEMIDLGLMNYFLNKRVRESLGHIFISQKHM